MEISAKFQITFIILLMLPLLLIKIRVVLSILLQSLFPYSDHNAIETSPLLVELRNEKRDEEKEDGGIGASSDCTGELILRPVLRIVLARSPPDCLHHSGNYLFLIDGE